MRRARTCMRFGNEPAAVSGSEGGPCTLQPAAFAFTHSNGGNTQRHLFSFIDLQRLHRLDWSPGRRSTTCRSPPRTHAARAMSEIAKGCSHFGEFRRANGLQSYRVITRYLVKPSPEARKLKVTRGPCTHTHTHTLARGSPGCRGWCWRVGREEGGECRSLCLV